jgi:hypothetical protein
MIKEYSEYSGKSVDTLESNISICNKLITEEISSYQKNREKSTIDILVDSKNLIYDIIRYPFNIDKAHLLAKYQLFSPYMMNMIISSGYTSFLEYMGGVGVLSEIIKENLIDSKVTFNSINNEIFHFSKWRFEKKGLDISTIGYIDKDKNYDVVVSDGFLQYLDSPDQEYLVQEIQKININLPEKGFYLRCQTKQDKTFLTEVRVCYDKLGQFAECKTYQPNCPQLVTLRAVK